MHAGFPCMGIQACAHSAVPAPDFFRVNEGQLKVAVDNFRKWARKLNRPQLFAPARVLFGLLSLSLLSQVWTETKRL